MLSDRVVVRPVEEADKTPAGLIIPETAREKPQRGSVVFAGPKSEVTDGDEVLYTKYGSNEVQVDEEWLLLLRDEHIIAVVINADA